MNDETPRDDVTPATEPTTQPTDEHHRRWTLGLIRKYFITGLVVAIPVGLTIYLAWSFVAFVDTRVMRLFPAAYNPETYLPYSIPGLGLIILLVAVTLLGALTANLFGKKLIELGERIVVRMPVVRNIYNALKQITETVVAQSDSSFQDVCLIEYPRRGIYAIGFITTETKGEIQQLMDKPMVSIFLPTTPNPTSGFLLFLPLDDVQILDLTVEEGAKLVISAGLVSPEDYEVPSSNDVKDSSVKKFLKAADRAQRKIRRNGG